MTDQHPITPPRELKQKWHEEAAHRQYSVSETEDYLIEQAAQLGYDQRGKVNEAELQEARDEELEACCEWLKSEGHEYEHEALFAARRPKPPSDKEQACRLLECYRTSGVKLTADQCNTILRALKALPND